VDPHVFVFALAVGAAALALWAEARLARFAPDSLAGVVRRGFEAFMGLYLAGALFAVAARHPQPVPVIGVFVLQLPAIVYCFVTCIWTMRHFQEARSRHVP